MTPLKGDFPSNHEEKAALFTDLISFPLPLMISYNLLDLSLASMSVGIDFI